MHEADPVRGEDRLQRERPALRLSVMLLYLLAAQFLLGMTTNLNAMIPATPPGVRGNFDARLDAAARWPLLHVGTLDPCARHEPAMK